MNYIKHLTGFFEKVAKDKQVNASHVSIYMALFQFWNCNRFRNPISISRDEVMRISKISSKATYHKCLKGLHHLGYIKYEPSFNPFRGSHVIMFNFADDLKPIPKNEKPTTKNFEPVIEQVADNLQTSNNTTQEQLDEQVVVPSINNINNANLINVTKSLNLEEQAKKKNNDFAAKSFESVKKEKSSAKKEKPLTCSDNDETLIENRYQNDTSEVPSRAFEMKRRTASGSQVNIPPEFEEVLAYFREKEYPEIEANKFFNYFKSIGWLVSGKTPMADWHAGARNWILNVPKFITAERTDRTKQLDTSTTKNYAEPL